MCFKKSLVYTRKTWVYSDGSLAVIKSFPVFLYCDVGGSPVRENLFCGLYIGCFSVVLNGFAVVAFLELSVAKVFLIFGRRVRHGDVRFNHLVVFNYSHLYVRVL